MTIEENKAVVRRHLEDAWNRNKIAELEDLLIMCTIAARRSRLLGRMKSAR